MNDPLIKAWASGYNAAIGYRQAVNNPPLDGPAAEAEADALVDATLTLLARLPYPVAETVLRRLLPAAAEAETWGPDDRVTLAPAAHACVAVTEDDGWDVPREGGAA